MFKKMLMTGLLIATVLPVSACGKDSGSAGGTGTVEPSSTESQPTEEETEGSTEDDSQSTEESTEDDSQSTEETEGEEEEETEDNSASYIFSVMPIVAYEVTGLKVGPDASFYDEPFAGDDYNIPLVELGENTFILYCLPGGDESDENGEGSGCGVSRLAAVQSPPESGPWEAHTYTTGDYSPEYVPEGYSRFSRMSEKYGDFTEETYGGRFGNWVDPWIGAPYYIRFSEIFHPDAPQTDTIYVIEIVTSAATDKDEEAVLSAMISAFEDGKGGATLNEIPVEEALAKNNIVVSESNAN